MSGGQGDSVPVPGAASLPGRKQTGADSPRGHTEAAESWAMSEPPQLAHHSTLCRAGAGPGGGANPLGRPRFQCTQTDRPRKGEAVPGLSFPVCKTGVVHVPRRVSVRTDEQYSEYPGPQLCGTPADGCWGGSHPGPHLSPAWMSPGNLALWSSPWTLNVQNHPRVCILNMQIS